MQNFCQMYYYIFPCFSKGLLRKKHLIFSNLPRTRVHFILPPYIYVIVMSKVNMLVPCQCNVNYLLSIVNLYIALVRMTCMTCMQFMPGVFNQASKKGITRDFLQDDGKRLTTQQMKNGPWSILLLWIIGTMTIVFIRLQVFLKSIPLKKYTPLIYVALLYGLNHTTQARCDCMLFSPKCNGYTMTRNLSRGHLVSEDIGLIHSSEIRSVVRSDPFITMHSR